MKKESSVYVVVPVHNRKVYTLACLACITNQTIDVTEIIVVDDGSTDGTAEAVRAQYPDVTVLAGNGNLWWVGSANMGVEYVLQKATQDDYLLMLNNDLVVDNSYLETLVGAIQHRPHSIIGSVVSLQDDREAIWSSGERTNWWTGSREKVNLGRRLSEFVKGHVETTSVLTGRGVLFPVKVFHDVGIYSPHFIQYGGDTELPRRAAKRAGWNLYVCYDAVVYNYRDEKRGINDGPYRLKDLCRYYFDIRSNTSLRVRFWSSWLCTENPVQFISFFVLTFLRTLVRFVRMHSFFYKPAGILR